MRKFYLFEPYAKLEDFETGLYLESHAYVYELFKDEVATDNGFVQN